MYRAMYFYAVQAHHLTKGPTFLQDHEFFAELYSAYEGAFDMVAERCIGTGEKLDFPKLTQEACRMFSQASEDMSTLAYYKRLLSWEGKLCTMLAEMMKGQSEGTKNLLAQLCDDGEVRQYKMGQRLK